MRAKTSPWPWPLLVLLFAWGARLCCLETVPPGWRDDELINIHVLSGAVLDGHYPLYFTGASGHEPLYHYLHAGVHAVLGFNVLSGHILSAALGLLSVALTYALARRLFGREVGLVAALTLAASFWSLMYSRIGLRHIALPPLALGALVLVAPLASPAAERPRLRPSRALLLGLLSALAIYTYPAGRLLPVLLLLFAAYLFLLRRERDLSGLLLALATTALLTAPLAFAIARGTSEAAAQGIGADARLSELAVPLRELRNGDPRPLLNNVWTTLGMFHATGDPEWLYNIAGRPVFSLAGGLLFWAGVLVALRRLREPRYFLLLLWLGLGLLPTFLSVPPASLSHSILAQPAVYILLALPLRRARARPLLAAGLAVVALTVPLRDLHDYFVRWPERGMVRFLYRADYREAARYLDGHPEIEAVSVPSVLMGPWDRVALQVDLRRADLTVRLFDPRRALLWASAAGDESPTAWFLLTSHPSPAPPVAALLRETVVISRAVSPHLTLIAARRPPVDGEAVTVRAAFADGLTLETVRFAADGPLVPDGRVAAPPDLPPLPLIANPPPPGVYNGPRLAVFAHLLAADGGLLAGDDGFWADPLTLRPGDHLLQIHHLTAPPASPCAVEIGLYDPLTGERVPRVGADEERVVLHCPRP